MRKLFITTIDSLYYLLSGKHENEPYFKEKLKMVIAWLVIISVLENSFELSCRTQKILYELRSECFFRNNESSEKIRE